MMMSTDDVISITEANQNFKNNRPTYVIYPFDRCPMELTDEERLDIAEKRVMSRYRKAFEDLAKS